MLLKTLDHFAAFLRNHPIRSTAIAMQAKNPITHHVISSDREAHSNLLLPPFIFLRTVSYDGHQR